MEKREINQAALSESIKLAELSEVILKEKKIINYFYLEDKNKE